MRVVGFAIALAIFIFPCVAAYAITQDEEVKIGQEMNKAFFTEKSAVKNSTEQARIEMIGQKLVKVSERPELKYTFTIYEDDVPNACAFPGGFVNISSSLLKECKTDDELAGIIAHEIAHCSLLHGIKELDASGRSSLLSLFVDLVTHTHWAGMISGLKILRMSRQLEAEADQHGLVYIKNANYNPFGTVGIYGWMLDSSNSKNNQCAEFLETHPDMSKRYQSLYANVVLPYLNTETSRLGLPIKKNDICLQISGSQSDLITKDGRMIFEKNAKGIAEFVPEMPKPDPAKYYDGKREYLAKLFAGEQPAGKLSFTLLLQVYDPITNRFVNKSNWTMQSDDLTGKSTTKLIEALAKELVNAIKEDINCPPLQVITRSWHKTKYADYEVRFETYPGTFPIGEEFYVIRNGKTVGLVTYAAHKLPVAATITAGDILVAHYTTKF